MSRREQVGRTLRTSGRALVLAVGGVVLAVASLALPAYETLLVAWGGTALFGGVLLVLLGRTRAVRAEVATDVYTALAGNCRERVAADRMVYVPSESGVQLVAETDRLEPTGAALVDRIEAASVTQPQLTSGRLQALVDGLIAELELVDDAAGETGDGEAQVTASGCRIGTGERFDHPVVSVVGVGLARTVEEPVRVEADAEGDSLVVSCYWGEVDAPAASAGVTQQVAGGAGTDGTAGD